MDKKTLLRFLDKVEKTSDGCWEWTASKNAGGYGQFNLNGTPKLAHRVSYAHFFGHLGDGFICHKCDNPSCVNPNHLFHGTPEDNVQDMVLKDRHSGRLTSADVAYIRKSGKTLTELASIYGVAVTTISAARSGQTFRHVAAQPRHGNKQGEDSHSAKLSDSDVRAIYLSRKPKSEIAATYGISVTTINRIKRRASRAEATEMFGT